MANQPLSNLNIERFGKILGMLVESTDDNSKLSAISRANAMLKTAGLNWDDISDALAKASNAGKERAKNPFDDISEAFWAARNQNETAWPSPKQARPTPRKILQDGEIPVVIYGEIDIQDVSTGHWGQSLIVNVFDETLNTIYGPARIFDEKLVEDLLQRPRNHKLKTFFKVQQPTRSGHLPVLVPRRI